MILVVIAVQAVAPDGDEVVKRLNEPAHMAEVLAVGAVIHRVGLLDAVHAPVDHVRALRQPHPRHLLRAELDQIRIGHVPQFVAFVAEVLQAQAGLALVRHHVRAPIFEVLDAAYFDIRLVDVNPVVGKEVRLIDDEADGEKVAVLE